MPALQPPSRTATPTPIDALLAPLHLTPDTDRAGGSLATAAPAGFATPHFDNEEDIGGPARTLSTASLFDLVDSTATKSTTTPTPRRRTAANGTHSDTGFGTLGVVAAVASGSGWSSPSRRRPILDAESSQGRASTTTPTSARRGGGGGERDVIVHKVLKTDSIASISVKYGITPQALRASNRLWPSDPLFLRSQLLIPLDRCTAAAAAAALRGRLDLESRAPNGDQQGDLMNWDADADSEAGDNDDGRSSASPMRPSPAARPKLGEPPPPPPPDSPQTATFDGLADSPATTPQPQSRESSEYLTVWDDADGGTGAIPVAAAVAAALAASRSPKGFGDGAQDDRAMLATPRAATDPFGASGRRPPLSSEPRSNSQEPSPVRPDDSIAPRASSDRIRRPAGLNGAPLRIERMPASELAFFPAPVASPPLASTSNSSTERRPTRAHGANHHDGSNKDDDDDSSSLFFRPLAKQLQQMSIPLPSFLSPSSSSSSANSISNGRGGGGGGSGRIRLPPSPLLSPSTSASSLSGLQTLPDPSGSNGRPQHRRKDSSARSGPPVSLISGGSGSGSKKKGGGGGWGLLDFGAEEDEANQVVQLRQLESYRSSSGVGDRSAGIGGPGRLGLARRGSSSRTITAADFWNEPAAKGAR